VWLATHSFLIIEKGEKLERRDFLKFVPPLMAMAGCSKSITGPGNGPLHGAWSPYLGMHTFAWFQEVQQPHLKPLFDARLVNGVRVDASPAGVGCAQWALAHGAQDILAIFKNRDLVQPNIEELFDRDVAANSYARYWEVGNEVGLFINMPPEEYWPLFLRIHRHARKKHPGLIVMPYAPVGGTEGARSFETMMRMTNGINHLAWQGELSVLSLHVYSNSISFFSKVSAEIQRLPPHVQIWVTETGVDDHTRHVDYVLDYYPKLRKLFRAARIYWYVFAECTGFSLVKGLASACPEPIVYSPLYQQLTGILEPPVL
jgi:hypothetical protein